MYKPIIGTLGYILSPDGQQTLLVNRKGRPDDHHLGKYNGLGGKMKTGEDVLSCFTREVYEEAGIICEDIQLRGTINWTGFGPNGENWLGFIFLVRQFTGTPYSENEEGPLGWYPLTDLGKLPMWRGDRYFLPLVFDGDKRLFFGHMPYKNGRPLSWVYKRL